MKISLDNKELDVQLYNTFFKRFIGLMGQKNIKKSIVFPKCNSIHTFFMKEEIDVVMTNKNGKILHAYKALKPWRLILPKKDVYYTFEFPHHTITGKEKELKMK